MREEVITAGFGGQGIMLMGKLLAYGAMKEGYQVSWIPSYGPEMRGGTANCTVIISDEKIGSPLATNPDTVMVMNRPSLEKFGISVRKGGRIFVNSSLVAEMSGKDDQGEIISVPATKLAREIGNEKVANMVLLGAYLARNNFIKLDTLKEVLRELIGEKGQRLIKLNQKALEKGVNI